MQGSRHTLTIGGRVNEDQLARVDAAARLARMPRAHFVVAATLQMSESVLREAVVAAAVAGDDQEPAAVTPSGRLRPRAVATVGNRTVIGSEGAPPS